VRTADFVVRVAEVVAGTRKASLSVKGLGQVRGGAPLSPGSADSIVIRHLDPGGWRPWLYAVAWSFTWILSGCPVLYYTAAT
jgi:hypothetical protein